MTHISFITIGSELLKGKIVNTNAAEVGKMLRRHGYTLNRVVTISDTREEIQKAVEQELADHDVVLVSGGLGPTRDDITKFTLADIFSSGWRWDEDVLVHLKKRYQEAGRVLNELTQKQAYLPDNCKTVPNTQGTAPGMEFQRGGKYLFSMPGVPYELLEMMDRSIIPRIDELFPTQVFHQHIIRLANVSESAVAEQIDALDQQWPKAVELAYLPRLDGLWLELQRQAPAEDAQQGLTELDQAIHLIRETFPSFIYTEGDGSLSLAIQRWYRARGLSLSVAESITGGGIAGKLVAESGASHFFKGSITAYDTAFKIKELSVDSNMIDQHGVVSAEVAEAMAAGVRAKFGADVGIATTGWAEKEGDRQGLVWMGFSTKEQSLSRSALLRYQRGVNLERAANYALQFCLMQTKQFFP